MGGSSGTTPRHGPRTWLKECFLMGTFLADGKALLRPWVPFDSETLRDSWASAGGQLPAAHQCQLS